MNIEKVKSEFKSIVIILVSVFAFRSVVFEPYRIPSGSMIPTLMIGDFILVNKFSYGAKLPFSDLAIFNINWNPIYIFGKSEPQRGDIIVFKYPKEPSINYIKRVVALPGDTIEVINKFVYINGKKMVWKELDGKEIMDDMDEKFKNYNFKFYKQKIGKHEHVLQIDEDNYFKVNYEKRIVPKGHYFVMGDNRDYSADSRYWGFVPFENIRGKAILVWFSMIFPIGEDNFKFRPWRIGHLLD